MVTRRQADTFGEVIAGLTPEQRRCWAMGIAVRPTIAQGHVPGPARRMGHIRVQSAVLALTGARWGLWLLGAEDGLRCSRWAATGPSIGSVGLVATKRAAGHRGSGGGPEVRAAGSAGGPKQTPATRKVNALGQGGPHWPRGSHAFGIGRRVPARRERNP